MDCPICMNDISKEPRISVCGQNHQICLQCWVKCEEKQNQCCICRFQSNLQLFRVIPILVPVPSVYMFESFDNGTRRIKFQDTDHSYRFYYFQIHQYGKINPTRIFIDQALKEYLYDIIMNDYYCICKGPYRFDVKKQLDGDYKVKLISQRKFKTFLQVPFHSYFTE